MISAAAFIPGGKAPVIAEGLRWGGIVLGHRSTRAQRVEAWAQEYYGAHFIPPEEDGEGFSEAELRKSAWDPLEFVDFGQYCEERLGMARRTVLQRVALERALLRIPLLRQALREKRISYEKARVIARHWESGHAGEVRPLIAMAERMTCIDLRQALADHAGEQMCAAGTFTLTAPPSIFDLVKDTLRAARALAKRSISLGTCFVELAGHFAEVWKAHVKERMTKRNRILHRDHHRCQVPGCSRPAVHLHHIEYRSHGGDDDESNLLCLCAAHHLFGIHEDRMRVTGKAPDELVWEFGLRRRMDPGVAVDRGPGSVD